MNISQFREGDIVTRVEPALNGSPNTYGKGDRSYMRDALEFICYEDDIIYLLDTKGYAWTVIKLSGKNGWAEGWDFYPQRNVEKVKRYLAKKVKGVKK
jgi:hypothetical protein